MRIAFLAPLVESVPPRLYGGTERVVAWLSEELVRRGHAVTLHASGDSRTSGRLVAAVPRALRLSGVHDSRPDTQRMLERAFAAEGEHDVVHSHVDWMAFPFARSSHVPVVHTLHGRLDLPHLPAIYARYPDLELVSISDAQRRPLPGTRFRARVHHGMPRDLFRFQPRAGDHLLFLGRLSPEKGPELAIRAAQAAGVRLVVAAKVDPADEVWCDTHVRPLLAGPGVEFVGEISDVEKQDLLGRARALLAPITWPEPFGLVYIEALACGTPVITRPCGSAPELIEHGRTGYLASTVAEIARAIETVGAIDRAACRATFEARFAVERMADGYERVYAAAIAARAGRRRERAVGS